MAVKFSLAPLRTGSNSISPAPFDLGQGLQVAANLAKGVVTAKNKEQDEFDQNQYFQANIDYRNRSMKLDQDLANAGNDLNAQRGVLDTYNSDVGSMAESYGLNEKYTSTFTSSIENKSSKLESRYRGAVNRRDKNVVESNITDVVANSLSLEQSDWVTQANGLKTYAIQEGHTPQQASQMITKAYVNSQLAGLNPQEMTLEQAKLTRDEMLSNLTSFDDRLSTDISYKQAKGQFDSMVDQVQKKEKAEFDAYLGYSQISKGAMNAEIDAQRDRGIYNKEEAEFKKFKYSDKLLREEARATALDVAKGRKATKVAKEQRALVTKQFTEVLNSLKVGNTAPVELTPADVTRMITFKAGDKAVGVEDLKFAEQYNIKYNIRNDGDFREKLIESNSLSYVANANQALIKSELKTVAQGAYEQGNYDLVATMFKNHGIKGIAGKELALSLQDPTQVAGAIQRFSALKSKGIARGMMNAKTYLKATVYNTIGSVDEEGNFKLDPNLKAKADEYLNDPELVTVDMEEFNDVFTAGYGSGNFADRRQEYKIRVALGEDAEDVAEELEATEEKYRPIEGVDLSGLEINTEKIEDKMEKIVEYIQRRKSVDGQNYSGYAYNKEDKQFYWSTPTDKYNFPTGHKTHDSFVLETFEAVPEKGGFIEFVEPTTSAESSNIWSKIFHKPTQAEIRTLSQSLGR